MHIPPDIIVAFFVVVVVPLLRGPFQHQMPTLPPNLLKPPPNSLPQRLHTPPSQHLLPPLNRFIGLCSPTPYLLHLVQYIRIRNRDRGTHIPELGSKKTSPVLHTLAITVFESGGRVAPCGTFHGDGAGEDEVAATRRGGGRLS